jgi:hypothetical protein
MSLIKETIQLAPFEIWEVMLDNSTIKFFEPLLVQPEVLQPEESSDPKYWTVDVPELDLSAVGISLDELGSCVRSDIRMTWKRIVQKHDNELTPDQRAVKRRFLKLAEEVNDG